VETALSAKAEELAALEASHGEAHRELAALQQQLSEACTACEEARSVAARVPELDSALDLSREELGRLREELAGLRLPGGEAVVVVPKDGKTIRREALFHRIDLNGNGTVDRGEVLAVHRGGDADALFSKLDGDGDGKVTMEEWMGLFTRVEAELGAERASFFLDYLESSAKEVTTTTTTTAAAAETQEHPTVSTEAESPPSSPLPSPGPQCPYMVITAL